MSTMCSVVYNDMLLDDEDQLRHFLNEEGLYKTLSLLEACRHNIPIPPTVLFYNLGDGALNSLLAKWSLPVTMRMDYKAFPQSKPLGGISLASRTGVRRIMRFLYKHKLYPLLHPYINRFDNIYSVGALIRQDSLSVDVEIVGRGFDAGDLRLGQSCPHQRYTIDLSEGIIKELELIGERQYSDERKARIVRRSQLKSYAQYADDKGELLNNLNVLPTPVVTGDDQSVPAIYSPIPGEHLRALSHIIEKVVLYVLQYLPYSNSYVASISYVKDKGWLLWDIYGSWYVR